MRRLLLSLILCSGFSVLTSACATKSFVQEQVSATETRLTQRADIQETKLREALDRAALSRQAIDAADQRLGRLDTRVGQVATRVGEVDTRVGEVGTLARNAQTRVDVAAEATHAAEGRLAQRIAARNRYRLLETRSIYFDRGQAALRSESFSELEHAAKALRADANAVVELQGFADPRGSDRYNYRLAHERVETVIRYLVQQHEAELRQIGAVAIGRVALVAGEKASPEALAKARRVDIRLLTPWSSWEDAQAQTDQLAPAQPATGTAPAPVESAEPTQAATVVPPAQPGGAPAATIALRQPVTPTIIDIPPREASPAALTVRRRADAGGAASEARPLRPDDGGDELKGDAVKTRLREFLNSISPRDLGGTE